MKNWFKNLESTVRKNMLIVFWITTVALFFIIGIAPENSTISDICVWLWLGSLVCSIIFSVWAAKFKKETDTQSKNNSTVTSHYTPKATTPIYSPKSGSAVPMTSGAKPSSTPITTTVNNEEFTYPKNKTFFFVDVETATRSNDTICAIGAMVVKNGISTPLYSLINPQMHITNTSIHGISDSDVADAPILSEFWPRIAELIGDDYIIIGHNVAFDISVLNKDLERFGYEFNPTRKIDTMAVAKDILYHFSTQAGDLKLDTICNKLNICLNHHNAESDITATKQALETLLLMGKRDITDFINMRHSSPRDNAIGNVKKVGTQRYWDDIYAGRTPLYFTNWNNVSYDADPQYDEIELTVLQFSSMMDRSTCEIPRIVKQVELIKSCVESMCGKIYGKGAKKAKCYIEFYYMDVAEYLKLKAQGCKIYHAIDVENFILENQDAIQQYAVEQTEAATEAAAEKERLTRERDERRAQREARKLEPKEPPKKTTRRVAQMNDDGDTINVFESLTEAIKATGINSKSIRDCCNGVQKHAGGFVWKYLDDDVDIPLG